jgi:hypothetical protein
MKNILLLLTFFILLVQVAVAQSHQGDCDGKATQTEDQLLYDSEEQNEYAADQIKTTIKSAPAKPQIYPNPAIHYFEVTGDDIDTITIYNIVGRKMKTFIAQENKKYNIEDLPMGMYLVQVFGPDNKILSTSRLSKRLP